VNESDQPIFDMFEAYKAAVFAKDVDALVAHYGVISVFVRKVTTTPLPHSRLYLREVWA
jgi:ketosteroid isomerase-like protein